MVAGAAIVVAVPDGTVEAVCVVDAVPQPASATTARDAGARAGLMDLRSAALDSLLI
jgi:hypothetical protein